MHKYHSFLRFNQNAHFELEKEEKMPNIYKSYLESFPDEFSIAHKISEQTEKKSFHMHKQLEIVYTISDNMKCRTEKGTRSIPANHLILLNSMDLHYFFTDPGSGLCDRYVLYFSPSFISPLSTQEVNLLESFNPGQIERPIVLQAEQEETAHYLSLMAQMISQVRSLDEFSAGDKSRRRGEGGFEKILYIKFLLGQFLLMVDRLYHQTYGHVQDALYQSHSQLVMDICSFIQEHMQEEDVLAADSLAKHFHISKTQMYNLFKKVMGLTANDFLIECRITSAKNYLINTEYSVEMVGELVGYRNISSFSRIFKAVSGCSPLQYRKKHRPFTEF